LWRVTKPGGFTISTLFTPWDGYYRPLVTASHTPIVVTDPPNGITKELYNKASFRKQFTPPFKVEYFIELEFEDIVQSRTYHINILAMALRKLG
jgi:hypothetical protein